ncbi:hypothetical protein BC829DRAFT_407979 [Chytridium lagenaria]|nr:hypothetical protein BC829DRAFT_407979 [Chytridium lagenaria]
MVGFRRDPRVYSHVLGCWVCGKAIIDDARGCHIRAVIFTFDLLLWGARTPGFKKVKEETFFFTFPLPTPFFTLVYFCVGGGLLLAASNSTAKDDA